MIPYIHIQGFAKFMLVLKPKFWGNFTLFSTSKIRHMCGCLPLIQF